MNKPDVVKTIKTVLLPITMLLSGNLMAAESHDHIYIAGPTHLAENEQKIFELKNLPDSVSQQDIQWFSTYSDYDAARYFKPNGFSVQAGAPYKLATSNIRLTAAVKIAGKYQAFSHYFCQDSSIVKCDGIVAPQRVNAGEGVTVDAAARIKSGREHRQAYFWLFDQNANIYLKDVVINRGQLSFTAPELKESKKISLSVIISEKNAAMPQTRTSVLKHDICLIGKNGDDCGIIDNPQPVVNLTAYDYQYNNADLAKFKRGSKVLDKGTIYTCVEPSKCQDPQYRPASLHTNVPAKGAEAWIKSYF
ncbi:MAG: hypothetical protein P4L95_16995 [Rouxiella aceris]|uniref:hypothetical protein n=1 Tax=Rouxiella aceris TaxID=2703884 RepID=UPI00283B13EF|nr:hypothetical protein [Rouxiella aceris]MDR3433570.1 hypothetical protein [Rouxiella aceris]